MVEKVVALPAFDGTPLDALMLDERSVFDPARLAELLQKFARFTDRGEFVPEPSFDELDNQRKVVVFLLAKKAMKMRGVAEDELAGPAEIASACSMANGSAKTALRRLSGFMVEGRGGKYGVPARFIERVRKVLQDGGRPRR
ncbi:MAG: hypothetical protein V1787_01800 [Candidatus Micrarchaeota archaeon]